MSFGTVLRPLRLCLAVAGFVLASWTLSAAPALADLRVCNETANPISVALGYRADKGWQSEGWWVAPPTKCAIVFQGELHSRFFYLYAADDIGGGAWDGTNFMCTRDETFTIFGVEDCLARGYERTGFFEVDTQSQPDWTLQLTDAPASPDDPGPDTGAGDDIPADPGADPGTDQGTGPGAEDIGID
ncbi:MAG: DUF1036 domain-containing protein [Devosia sp.]